MRIGLIGYGFIGRFIADRIQASDGRFEIAFIHNRSAGALADLDPALLLDDPGKADTRNPDLIVECAHPDITVRFGESFLRCADYMPFSVTALADDALRARLLACAQERSTRVLLPRGALLGGNELLSRAGRWTSVRITFRKHPDNIDFADSGLKRERIDGETVIYEGSVRGIARLYPRNVNTMVACALVSDRSRRVRGPPGLRPGPRLRRRGNRGPGRRRGNGPDGKAPARDRRFRHGNAPFGVAFHSARIGVRGFRNGTRLIRRARTARQKTRMQFKEMNMNRFKNFARPAALALAILALSVGPGLTEDKRVAIASLGPHPVLKMVVDGFKSGLASSGFEEGSGVEYVYKDSNFDPSLVAQLLTALEATSPDLLLTVTTPITQASRRVIRNKSLPIVFAPVTDPVDAGLVESWESGSDRFVGASNLQDMDTVLENARLILGEMSSMGLLFNPGDANDRVNVNYAEAAAERAGIELRTVSVETVNDIPNRVEALAGVDFIYLIPSSMLQPSLPVVAASAHRNGDSRDQREPGRCQGRPCPGVRFGFLEGCRRPGRTSGRTDPSGGQAFRASDLSPEARGPRRPSQPPSDSKNSG